MARKAASSSRSKIEYLVSVSDNFLVKKARGAQDLSTNFCKTVPTCVAEASTARARVAEGNGFTKRDAVARALLASWKAESISAVHWKFRIVQMRIFSS